MRNRYTEIPYKPLNYKHGPLREKLTLPQTVDHWLTQNPSQFYDYSDTVDVLSWGLCLNLKIDFQWENAALKWAIWWSISFFLLTIWLTIHFNKQVAVELLSTHVNKKMHLFLFFTVITFYLVLKASWLSAQCSIWNHICSIQRSILIFRFRTDISYSFCSTFLLWFYWM